MKSTWNGKEICKEKRISGPESTKDKTASETKCKTALGHFHGRDKAIHGRNVGFTAVTGPWNAAFHALKRSLPHLETQHLKPLFVPLQVFLQNAAVPLQHVAVFGPSRAYLNVTICTEKERGP